MLVNQILTEVIESSAKYLHEKGQLQSTDTNSYTKTPWTVHLRDPLFEQHHATATVLLEDANMVNNATLHTSLYSLADAVLSSFSPKEWYVLGYIA